MDSIYSEGQATVIAAAGNDATYGLPGVGRPRPIQLSVQINEKTLVSTLPDPQWLVDNSKWATRGWVYQEALLSRRRLVFTEHQVYYQCHGIHYQETIDSLLGALHNKKRGNSGHHGGIFLLNVIGEDPRGV
jgi:hypothetical protein